MVGKMVKSNFITGNLEPIKIKLEAYHFEERLGADTIKLFSFIDINEDGNDSSITELASIRILETGEGDIIGYEVELEKVFTDLDEAMDFARKKAKEKIKKLLQSN